MAVYNEYFDTIQTLTITLASLASSATGARESLAVDNSTNLYLDALVQVKVTLQAGTPGSDKAVYIYAYGSSDGTALTDNATGADAALTLRSPTNLRLIGTIACPDAGGLGYVSAPMSVAAAFGGILPPKWGIVVQNYTNIALSATAGDHWAKWRPVLATAA